MGFPRQEYWSGAPLPSKTALVFFVLFCVSQHFIINVYWFLIRKCYNWPALPSGRSVLGPAHMGLHCAQASWSSMLVNYASSPTLPWRITQAPGLSCGTHRFFWGAVTVHLFFFNHPLSRPVQFRSLLSRGQLCFDWYCKACSDRVVHFSQFWCQGNFNVSMIFTHSYDEVFTFLVLKELWVSSF